MVSQLLQHGRLVLYPDADRVICFLLLIIVVGESDTVLLAMGELNGLEGR